MVRGHVTFHILTAIVILSFPLKIRDQKKNAQWTDHGPTDRWTDGQTLILRRVDAAKNGTKTKKKKRKREKRKKGRKKIKKKKMK